MTRIAIDQDGDGAFAVITRPGAAAERVDLTHRDAVRLMSEAAQVVLVEEGRRQQLALERAGTHAGLALAPLESEALTHFLDQIEG